MTANWTSLRTHILFGSAYGLGLSVILWAVTLALPPLKPLPLLVLLTVLLIYPFHLLIRLTLERGKVRLERSKILTIMQQDLTHALAAAINAGNRQAGQHLEQTDGIPGWTGAVCPFGRRVHPSMVDDSTVGR